MHDVLCVLNLNIGRARTHGLPWHVKEPNWLVQLVFQHLDILLSRIAVFFFRLWNDTGMISQQPLVYVCVNIFEAKSRVLQLAGSPF